MTARRALGVIGLLAAGAAAPTRAQLAATLDVGAGTARSDDAFSGAVASLAPSLALDAGPLRLSAAGVYSNGPAGRWNFQGAAGGAVRSPRFGPFALEGVASLGWTWHQQVRGTTTLEGELRAWAYPSAATAVWLGASVGNAWSLGRWRPLRRSQVGTAGRLGPVRLAVSVTSTSFDVATDPTNTNTSSADTLGTGVGPRGVRRNTFTDGMLSGRWSLAALDFDVALGRRFSRSTPELMLWSATVTRGITPQLALIAGAGRSGADPVTALPGSRYVVLGMRVRLGRPPGRPTQGADRSRKAAAAEAALRVGPAGPGGREISLRTRGAQTVELAGDFTDWLPVALERRGDEEWLILLPIAPGLHRVAVRLDGGPWRAPPGARAVESEFGPEVGEIVVE